VPGYDVFVGECIETMADMPDGFFDSIVTDPPYGLGFMGKAWDDLPPGIEWAEQCLRVLKPGGHLLAFGGTRTYHRLACAIEDAGFEIRDCITWLYGSGFPKSMDVSKAIDKAAGAEREVVGAGENWGASKLADGKTGYGDYAGDWKVTAPATPGAEQWQGWGTALKPASEPIVVARKPLVGTVAANVLAYGTGALNIDGSRIDTTDKLGGGAYAKDGSDRHDGAENWRYKRDGGAGEYVQPEGRWPANVALDEEAGQMLDAQSDKGGASRFFFTVPRRNEQCDLANTAGTTSSPADQRPDSALSHAPAGEHPEGNASSDCPEPTTNATPSGSSQSDNGATPMSRNTDAELSPDPSPDEPIPSSSHANGAGPSEPTGTTRTTADRQTSGGSADAVTSGSTSSSTEAGEAGLPIDSETELRFRYCAKASKPERSAGLDGKNIHPTVKPIKLMAWLCRLVTPPGGMILDPFLGSGSTGVAALKEGFNFVGIEREADYADQIAKPRLAHALTATT
jgi:hypothetical protein